jgi:4,5-dihydroxyphthalate decarboxylase
MAPLTAAFFGYMHTAPLKRGEVTVEGFDLEFVDQGSAPSALFRKQTRQPEYDICEMGITTAIAAREYGVPLTPIPVFPVRRFDYENIYVNVNAGLMSPADLAGKTIAVRTPNVTIDILCSAMLADLYGVDLKSIHWIVTGENHIAQANLPANHELRLGANPMEILESGEAAAIFTAYRGDNPDIQPLSDIPALFERARENLGGVTTIHHTIVIKNDTLAANPGLSEALAHAFTEAKQPFLTRINRHEDLWAEMIDATPMGPRHDYGIASMDELRLPDPVPYGLAKNGVMLESLLKAAYDLNYVSRAWEPSEIFACPGED